MHIASQVRYYHYHKESKKKNMKNVNESGIGKFLGLLEHFNPKENREIILSIMDRIRKHFLSWALESLNGVGK